MYFWQKVVFGLIGLIIVLIGAKQLDDVHTPVTIETESQIKKLVIKIINTPPGGICVVLGSIIILCTIVTPPPRMKISDKNGEILSIPIKKMAPRYFMWVTQIRVFHQ